jgi:hypothetical protein
VSGFYSEEGEGRQGGEHQGEQEGHRQPAGRLLGLTPAAQPTFDNKSLEGAVPTGPAPGFATRSLGDEL